MNKHDQAQFLDEYGLTNEYRYNEDHGIFESIGGSDFSEQFVNGAWFVWQDKQKKLDVLQKQVDAVRNIIKGKKEVLSEFENLNTWDECTEIQYSIAELEKALQGDKDA